MLEIAVIDVQNGAALIQACDFFKEGKPQLRIGPKAVGVTISVADFREASTLKLRTRPRRCPGRVEFDSVGATATLFKQQETTNPADEAGSVFRLKGYGWVSEQQDDLRGTTGPLLIASEPVDLARFALHFRVP